MFNLNINWLKIIKENLPFFLQTPMRIDWLRAAIAPFISIHGEFRAKYQVLVYKIAFTFQVIYIEKVLNNKFDPVNTGIYIQDAGITVRHYLYRKSESKPPIYKYRLWKQNINYVVGQFAIDENKVYKCLVNNSHFIPSVNPTQWQYHTDVKFKRRNTEFAIQYNFIIKVPASVTFDVATMRGLVDFYRYSGIRYTIEIY